MIKKLALLALVGCAAAAVHGETLFSDGFESGDLSAWTDVQSTGQQAVVNSNQVHSGTYAAYFAGVGTDPVDHIGASCSRAENVGSETIRYTFWMYDEVGTTLGGGRVYGTFRSYSSNTFNSGTLEQLYALGKNNSTTMPGEVFSSSKYQGRVAFGTGGGWFQANLAANRSIGWHKMVIEVTPTGLNYYIDDTLARTFASRFTVASMDSVTLGSGLSSSGHNTYFDDASVEAVPSHYSPVDYSIVGGYYAGGNVGSLANSDDNKLFVLADEAQVNAIVQAWTNIGTATPTSLSLNVETSSGRLDQTVFIKLRNVTSGLYETIDFRAVTQTDNLVTVSATGDVTRFVDPSTREVRVEVSFVPSSDIDAADGWGVNIDMIRFFAQ